MQFIIGQKRYGGKMKGIELSQEVKDKASEIMKKYGVTNEFGSTDIIVNNYAMGGTKLADIRKLRIYDAELGLAICYPSIFMGLESAKRVAKKIPTAINILQELKAVGVPVKD